MTPDRPLAGQGIAVERVRPTHAAAMPLPARRRAVAPSRDATTMVTVLLWLMVAAYAAYVMYAEWTSYSAFLMHAEDMGNMEQAVWNTAHGHPFAFNNQRQPWLGVEATGTTTRLSIHVEPILLLVAIPYLLHAGPLTLFALQTLVVASGVFPAAWLAKRRLTLPLAQVAFPLAYLLAPPLEAANLYEFHAVTLAAALLLWALYFADGARYGRFALFAALAVFTKEEIGLVVALMGVWIWWRHRDRTAGLTTAILGVGWSLFCVLVVIRHFHHGSSSPFCGRFNPYLINGHNTDSSAQVHTCLGVAKLWVQHPDQVLSIVLITQKFGFLHRMFITTGYLSLLNLPVLALSLPSYAIILFSNDVHMYSGLAQYPAELVPIMIGSAILGTAWLANQAARLRIPPAAVTTVACLWLLVASVGNTHVNGFTPLAEGYTLPRQTDHDRIGQKILALIPSDAAVAAGDYLNPHLSDRRDVYIFPDTADAQYAVVDVSRENFPRRPIDEMNLIRYCMLAQVLPPCVHAAPWGVVAAQDGYILLERRRSNPAHPAMGYNPALPTVLPPSFYTFVVPAAPPRIAHPLLVDFGPSLQLVGYDLQRRDQVNLRQPDVLLTTYWRLTAAVTSPVTPVVYLTNSAGAIDVNYTDHAATDWLPMTQWPVNRVVTVQTVPATVFTNENGLVDVDLAVYQPNTCPYYAAMGVGCDLLTDATHRYLPDTRWTPGHVPLEVVARGTILKLAQVAARW